jgi:hypothetical protein
MIFQKFNKTKNNLIYAKTVHVLWCQNLARYARHPSSMRKLQKQNTDFGNGPHPGSSPPSLVHWGLLATPLSLDLWLWNPTSVTQPPWLHKSVSDELVLIQLLNLVHSHRRWVTLFFLCNFRSTNNSYCVYFKILKYMFELCK